MHNKPILTLIKGNMLQTDLLIKNQQFAVPKSTKEQHYYYGNMHI
jgi:hypothetical protein